MLEQPYSHLAMPPTMSPATLRHQLVVNEQKLILCAKLSDFAYSSATPNRVISIDKDKARKRLDEILIEAGQSPSPVSIEGRPHHFERFASHSWLRSHLSGWWLSPDEFKWWRSHCYFYHYFDQEEKKNRIVVAFRGTWMGEGSKGFKPGKQSRLSREQFKLMVLSPSDDNARFWVRNGPIAWYNGFSRRLFPSNYGLSDLYYDATLIRIPYTECTVWKWFACWGSLVLEVTRLGRMSWLFYLPRLSAADWISRPDQDRIALPNRGTVHLGFWALWATPEGFAGYDAWSRYQEEKQRRMLHEVKVALDTGAKDKETEIMVVGHSLGGAVSCFAALDLVHKLIKWEVDNVTIFHATFGAPPVGDPAFQAYFNIHFNQQHHAPPTGRGRHQSWSIYHQRDVVASCFAWCGTKWQLKWLNWWGDWRGVGHRIGLCSDIDPPPKPPTEKPLPDEHPASMPHPGKIPVSESSIRDARLRESPIEEPRGDEVPVSESSTSRPPASEHPPDEPLIIEPLTSGPVSSGRPINGPLSIESPTDEPPDSEPAGNGALADEIPTSGPSSSRATSSGPLMFNTPTNAPPSSKPTTSVVPTDDPPTGGQGWWTEMKSWWTKVTGWLSRYAIVLVSCLLIAVLGSLCILICVLVVLAATVYSPWYFVRRLARMQKPLATAKPAWRGGRRPRDPCPDAQLMSTDFHSLHRYIYLMEQGHLRTHAALME
jgi:Lipase (class 3)